MLRQFSNLGLVLTLVSSGWCSAFAAAVHCPHTECRTPAAVQKLAHSHEQMAEAVEHHSPSEDASCHQGHEAATALQTVHSAGESFSLLNSRNQACSHCMSGSPAPPKQERRAYHTRDDGRGDAPRSCSAAVLSVPSFAPKAAPFLGAPPGLGTARHLLISVFRI